MSLNVVLVYIYMNQLLIDLRVHVVQHILSLNLHIPF
jgi:hypothetical protein